MAENADQWFENCSEDQRDLLIELRKLIKSCHKDFVEEIKWSQPCYSLGKLVCYLKSTKKHAVLGFQKGAHLDDPNDLLEGSGKDMRHVKVVSKKDIKKTAFKALIKAAIKFNAE